MAGPDFSEERKLIASGARLVAGVDEVGRGPLAGPVTAAAVVLDPNRIPVGLNDSKVLSAKVRDRLFDEIHSVAEVSVAHATVEEIDRLNILRASHLAMCRAVSGLPRPPDQALIDGNMIPRDLGCDGVALIKGDARLVTDRNYVLRIYGGLAAKYAMIGGEGVIHVAHYVRPAPSEDYRVLRLRPR